MKILLYLPINDFDYWYWNEMKEFSLIAQTNSLPQTDFNNFAQLIAKLKDDEQYTLTVRFLTDSQMSKKYF